MGDCQIGYFIIIIAFTSFAILQYCNCEIMRSLLGKIKKYKLALLIIATAIFPIFAYWLQFHKYGISHDTSDWGTFGDYIGGVYSVVLTIVLAYITYIINKRDLHQKEKREIIKSIYKQVSNLQSDQIDINKVNELTSYIIGNELVLSPTIFYRLIRITDYYKVVANDSSQINISHEQNIMELLKSYYNEPGI